MKKKVSIIIPTFNRYEQLFRAIDSALNQTYKNIEIIVVDDNYENNDLRDKIKNKIKKEYKKVKLVLEERKLGGSEARNVGFNISNGEYIAFLDDDDEYYNNKIEKQVKLFEEKKDDRLGLVYCYGKIIYPNGSTSDERTNYKGWPISIQMKYNIAGTSFWLIKRNVFEEIGGFKQIYSHQDSVVLLELLSRGYKIDLCEEDLVNYYFHAKGDGITDVCLKTIEADKEYLALCKKYFYMIPKREQKKVLLKYYDDRNWNLIILKKLKLASKDLIVLFTNFFITKTLLVCIFRIFFNKYYIKKEKKFDKEVLLDDKKRTE